MTWKTVNADAQSMRYWLIKHLGGKCERCGRRQDLQFHHIFGITWVANSVNQRTRMLRYSGEAKQGLIELRCGKCNRQEGRPF